MRSWPLVLVALLATQCSPSGGGTLELRANPVKIYDDGEETEISIKATDTEGKVGKGLVTITSSAGAVGQTPVQLDGFGRGTTTFTCDVTADPGCVDSAVVTFSWNGVVSELPVRLQERCPGGEMCSGICTAVQSSWFNCGACGVQCDSTQHCFQGSCQLCNPGDCDDDGWTITDGDCCDQYDKCTNPRAVNPGAVEALGNGVDDNCNGLLDDADVLDVAPCDTNLGPTTADAMDFARTVGLCRTTTEGGRTWGVISAELLLVNGDGGVDVNGATMRPVFGVIPPLEGTRLAVFASGPASDAVQTNPSLGSFFTPTSVDFKVCDGGACLKDWFEAARPPSKLANQLPATPNCGSVQNKSIANDSVMLRLRIRAPTNAKSFRLSTRFFSEEYPEYVCSSFNDQMVMLIDTPGVNVGNPSDKNLMTYSTEDGGAWPVGINLAAGSPLFQVCESKAANAACWDDAVNASSCGLGTAELEKTQYAAPSAGGCVIGGGTKWMHTRANVRPGAVFELRTAVWDVGDHILDSLVLLDGWQWTVDEVQPGTE